jgi:predicted transposase YbfD/YdcC
MDKHESELFAAHLGKLKDPRINRKKLYPLVEIMFVVISGSLCGAESWRDYVLFGKAKLDFMRQYYEFKHGIPSKNTFARLFASLDPAEFKACFVEWVKSLQGLLGGVIAIDGKRLCNSIDQANGLAAIHMVSAFATEARLVLAQQKVGDKSNEITAIPKLLNLLSLQGQIVTLDAMGTQKAIASQIIEKGGDYILALKGNQGTLNEDVRLFLETELSKVESTAITDRHEEADKGHGRLESRYCIVSEQIDWLNQKEQWVGLKSIVMIEETREMKGKLSQERRFFISSLPANAKQIAAAVRAHWLVENSLHWVLDVVFNEDKSRIRQDHAAENMAIVRHITLNMMSSTKKSLKDISLKAMRKNAGWDNQFLCSILKQNF